MPHSLFPSPNGHGSGLNKTSRKSLYAAYPAHRCVRRPIDPTNTAQTSNPTIGGGGDGHNMSPFPGGGCHQQSPSRGYILTNSCWHEFSVGQSCPSANGMFYPTPRRGPFGQTPHAIGDIFLPSSSPPYRWIAQTPIPSCLHQARYIVLGCGSLVRGRKRKKVDSRLFIY